MANIYYLHSRLNLKIEKITKYKSVNYYIMTKTIEETYKKLSQREHILLRSGMYVGSVKKQMEELWVFNGGKMEKTMIEYSPGFMKIFDEILTNATDHSFRDKTVKNIKVTFSQETGEISVWNDGEGIPVQLHKEHNIYVPELIFGHLLSGSNYSDSEQRIGAGTFGIGSKVTNIFSKTFTVETVDSNEKKKFIQTFSDNMSQKTKAKITSNSGKSYTKITFIPDYQRFDMEGLENDTILLIKKRVLDCIACTNGTVQVYLNGDKLKGKSLVDYTKYFFEDEKIISESHTERIKEKNGQVTEYIWEYAVVPYSQYEQVSFVNGNATNQGGKHVDYIMNQIINKLKKTLEDKKKLKELKPNFIKDKMFLFLRATVTNPSFNSQTKEMLTTPSKDFGCTVTVSDAFITKLYKSSITEEIIAFVKAKEAASVSKQTDGRKVNKIYIPKLEDALYAGGPKSKECTLILTEGDSAKKFAMDGRAIVGPEKYGVFPLRGKVLNIRDATISQLVGNEEINNIKQILGLKQDKVYKDTSELRYGKVMLLTDADSVTFDTPCLIKNINTGDIEYKPICEIHNDDVWAKDMFSNKEYNRCDDYLAWSDNGWTKIKSVMRHLVNKPIHRVLTHTGCVDVTEDHSLLNDSGEEITVKDILIKQTKLCHKAYVQEHFKDYGINEQLAWAMGYFCADGHCSIDSKIKQKRKDGTVHITKNYFWSITCVEKEPLEKLKKIFEEFEIVYDEQDEEEIMNEDEDEEIMEEDEDEDEEIIDEEIIDGEIMDIDDQHLTDGNLLSTQCALCMKIFNTEYDKKRHNKRNLTCNLQKEKKIESGTCEKCNKFFNYLERHNKNSPDCDRISKNVQCDKCLKIFPKPCQLKQHLKNKRPCVPIIHKCLKCSKIFKSSTQLLVHTKIKGDCTMKKVTYVIKEMKVSKNSFSEISGRKTKFILEANKVRKSIVLKYRKLFYNSLREKKIPIEILNNSIIIQQAFIDGFYAGDGNKGDRTTDCFDGEYKSQIAGLFQVLQNCGYKPSINCSEKKLNVYSLLMGYKYNRPEYTVKKLIDVSEKYQNTYVYDFETENHHFHGSIGNIIVHNCDAVHIRSLVINFLHYNWPSLIKMNFVQTLRTPIVKATKNKKVIEFFSEQDYLKWKDSGINVKSYNIKYFKGLGSSNKEDAKDTFKRLEELKIDYYYKDKKCDDSILLAFDKDKNTKTPKIKDTSTEGEGDELQQEIVKCTDRRKNWLSNYDKNLYVDVKENRVSFQDLINKELIHFSIYDNLRSIPSLCDGLKPSQRKILYYMLKTNRTQDIKVAQLSGYVSAEMGYHHGEASLQGAIIGMAQNFVGSNNINLLYPNGNFGGRLLNGKDAASPRYIFTYLETLTQLIFNNGDIPLLDFLDDDGTPIEPEWFLPIIPMILVNGCSGIGTGYSSDIPSYNPKDIVSNLLQMIEDEDFEPLPMKPYFRGFHGEVQNVPEKKGTFITKGKWTKLTDSQIKITELPVGTGVTTYKEFLESHIVGNLQSKKQDKTTGAKKTKKKVLELKDVQNKTRDENDDICFIVEFTQPSVLKSLIDSNTLEKELKLTKSFSTNNMYLFNEKLILTKYDTPNDILCDFFDIRLEYYGKRKLYFIKKIKQELVILESKARFIQEYIDGKLLINKKSKEYIIDLLQKFGYPKDGDDEKFDYLLRMPIYSFTLERINELVQNCKTKKQLLDFYTKHTPEQLWKFDLEELLKKL